MRAQLLHLSGPLRGQTITYQKKTLLIGTDHVADIRFPEGWSVRPHHAELFFEEDGCVFHLRALDGEVFVNRAQVREVILEHGDLIEFGRGGPQARFRIQVVEGEVCKPVYLMLRDAIEVGGASGLRASTQTLGRDLFFHATRTLKIGVPIAVVIMALIGAYFGGVLGSRTTVRTQQELVEQQAELYRREIGRLQEQLDAFRREQAGRASLEEVAGLRAELAEQAAVVNDYLARHAALKQVIDVYSRGVCLLHGTYTFHARRNGETITVTDPLGQPLELEYIGSGFLAHPDGYVLTNRHVAEPWWNNALVEPLLEQGLEPVIVHLTATFPDRMPLEVDVSSIVLSSEGVDLAILRVDVSSVPVLPLYTGEVHAARGERIVLAGYPTGLNAILARTEPEVVQEVLSAATDTPRLIVLLAERGIIQPVITQGALNAVTDRRLIYDAATTSGGSGGPVFGPDGMVIGVNFAVTRDFSGSNFGVPIRFANRLLPQS